MFGLPAKRRGGTVLEVLDVPQMAPDAPNPAQT